MKRVSLALFALGLMVSTPAVAEHHEEAVPAEGGPAVEVADSGEKVHSINPDLWGLLRDRYCFNYVYLLEGTHGFMIEPSFIIDSEDAEEVSTFGATVGYRWHWDGAQDSGFLGVNVGFAVGPGVSKKAGVDYDLMVTHFKVVPNMGWRWAWDFGLNITFRFGVGYGEYSSSTESDHEAAQAAVEAMDSFLNPYPWPVVLDGELSLGWNF